MGKKRKQRRQSHGSAWHWRQTDGWYYTPPGTKRRVPLVDEDGRRIRGKENQKAAELALAGVKLAGGWRPASEPAAVAGEWSVARVCSEYIEYCQRGVRSRSISAGHCDDAVRRFNELCEYCGVRAVRSS